MARAKSYPATVCTCGDCIACEFAAARRALAKRGPRVKPPPPPSLDERVAMVRRVVAATRLPVRQVEEALASGRTEADLLALAG